MNAPVADSQTAILEWLDQQRPAMTALLEKLVNIDSGSYNLIQRILVDENLDGVTIAGPGTATATINGANGGFVVRNSEGFTLQDITISNALNGVNADPGPKRRVEWGPVAAKWDAGQPTGMPGNKKACGIKSTQA